MACGFQEVITVPSGLNIQESAHNGATGKAEELQEDFKLEKGS